METTCKVNYYRSCNFCKTHSSMCDQLSPPSLFTSPPPLLARHRPASFPNTSLSLPQFATIIHWTISSVWSRHAVRSAFASSVTTPWEVYLLLRCQTPPPHHHHHLPGLLKLTWSIPGSSVESLVLFLFPSVCFSTTQVYSALISSL